MSYITRNHKQKAVYWGNPQQTGFGGFTFDDPVEVDVRWENQIQMFLNQDGKQSVSASIVYLSIDVVVEAYLWLGELSELSSSEEGDPTTIDGVAKISAVTKIPNLKGTEFETRAWIGKEV